jgi:hypothetical protein
MVSSILRRGGAWRFAALGFSSPALSPSSRRPAGTTHGAHTGTPGTLCGSVDTVAAIYEFQWSDWFYYPAPHFHRWHPPTNPSGWWDEHCGYEF